MNYAEQRAGDLLREVIWSMEQEVGHWLTHGASREMFCLVRRSARNAAEVVRILELHRRTNGLTPENLATLEQYRKIYEVSELVLLEYSSHPKI